MTAFEIQPSGYVYRMSVGVPFGDAGRHGTIFVADASSRHERLGAFFRRVVAAISRDRKSMRFQNVERCVRVRGHREGHKRERPTIG